MWGRADARPNTGWSETKKPQPGWTAAFAQTYAFYASLVHAGAFFGVSRVFVHLKCNLSEIRAVLATGKFFDR